MHLHGNTTYCNVLYFPSYLQMSFILLYKVLKYPSSHLPPSLSFSQFRDGSAPLISRAAQT